MHPGAAGNVPARQRQSVLSDTDQNLHHSQQHCEQVPLASVLSFPLFHSASVPFVSHRNGWLDAVVQACHRRFYLSAV
uniref:Uncharacterized protein n=1 Tax=Anopheles dirus TaxID=7168 RepID=A0A182NVW9_9DIPT